MPETILDCPHFQGYFDGRDAASPEPGANRCARYRHSFKVARAELAGRPIPAAVSRARVAEIARLEWLAGV